MPVEIGNTLPIDEVAEDNLGPPGDWPLGAYAPIRCGGCREVAVVWAPLTYVFYDDDHSGYFEIWYESRHAGQCAVCRRELEIVVRYTWRKRLPKIRFEIDVQQPLDVSKGVVGSLVGVPIPVTELRRAD